MICPYCAEEIQDGARKCKHCGEWLPLADAEAQAAEVTAPRETIPVTQKRPLSRGTRIAAYVAIGLGILGIAAAIWVLTADQRLSGPERVWRNYVRAVEARNGALAVSYWDFGERERRDDAATPKTNPNYDAVRGAALVQQLADAVEGLQRERINIGMGSDFSKWKGPTKIESDGFTTTLEFKVDGATYSVELLQADGEWKIINIITPEGPRPG